MKYNIYIYMVPPLSKIYGFVTNHYGECRVAPIVEKLVEKRLHGLGM